MNTDGIYNTDIRAEAAGRPLKMLHGFGIGRDDSKERREEIVDACLTRLYRLGYGGIVTNVDFDQYLESPANWETLRYAVRRAKALGFRVWLYDEHGYPSGGAGGITLRDHPEYEAQGLAEVTAYGAPGELISLELPPGHDYFVTAMAYAGSLVTPAKATCTLVRADASGIARAYAVKRVYEGTHAEHNVHESRRYINVLDPDAVRAFIDNTYEAYRRELGELFGAVEAIFTDEPSIMAAYLNAGLYPGRVLDKFDDSLPLLPLVVWDRRLPERYKERWGEDLLPKLGDLFGPRTDANAETRYRFHTVTSEMFEHAFFEQLGDWCASAGTRFSGHVLLEEAVLDHPIFEGNIFRFMSHMGLPGIDMLTTIPDGILDQAMTPKLISSAAAWFAPAGSAPRRVMSEISGHNEGARGVPYGLREMKGSVAMQRALGVTEFPSYYSDTKVSEAEFRDFCDFTARISNPLRGGNTLNHRILLLYPIEAAFAAAFGSAAQLGSREYTPEERKLERSWQRLGRGLLLSGLEYECVDVRGLLEETQIGRGRIIDRRGNCYRAVVFPYMNFETPELAELRGKLAAAGVLTFSDDEGTDASRGALLSELEQALAGLGILPAGRAEALTDEESPLLITTWCWTAAFEEAFLIVNHTDKAVDAPLTLNVPEWIGAQPGDGAIGIDPETGMYYHIGELNGARQVRIEDFKLGPMGALVVGIPRRGAN
ncbi:MAG: hypothetical protein II789_09335 [Clostridia bacterium]|nr:hypothetical protein [Clostridia bacterium]